MAQGTLHVIEEHRRRGVLYEGVLCPAHAAFYAAHDWDKDGYRVRATPWTREARECPDCEESAALPFGVAPIVLALVLLVPGLASAQIASPERLAAYVAAVEPDRPEMPGSLHPASVGLLWGCAAADVATTVYALRSPALKEGNSWLLGERPSAAKLIAMKAGFMALVHLVNHAVAKRPEYETLANASTVIVGVQQCGIALWNAHQMARVF